MTEPTGDDRGKTIGAVLALLLALAVWLWPIGIGGKMPVGGDVTQFSMGLMAVLHRALRSGRLPLWNDLWGYGFPGVAESQMGVFYPPHVLLYGLLPTVAAYTASLVLHTLWGALGTYWAARRFGISPGGAALAGFAWSTSGFFVIHLPHQWGYTTGSWMPWAWGLAWSIVHGEATRRTPFRLAVVLTLQVLPGHFQLAFLTQMSIVLMGLWGFGECRSRRHLRRGLALLCALAAVLPLSAAQLWPTFRLARLAEDRRDYEYLSGFAATPLHLISYAAPGLFHRSPLWRPLVWDPFHTSPEEHLAYIGLVPLFLALGAIVHGVRRDPGVRVLTVLALATMLLSLGPYLPGFRTWCQWPGFSFFRAPARWGLATALALALLAGRGFDTFRQWPRPGRSLARFALLAALALVFLIGTVELALASGERPGRPLAARGFERAFQALPWKGDPGFPALIAIARRPQYDLRVDQGRAREGKATRTPADRTFTLQRGPIYREELATTAILLLALLAVAPFLGRQRRAGLALVILSALDLWVLGRHRALDFAPIRPLEQQSPVLARLARLPRGTRSADGLGNLPMVAGAAPLSAYRTLDLPALDSLTHLAQAPQLADELPEILDALRITGTGVRVFHPNWNLPHAVHAPAVRAPRGTTWESFATYRDPTLASWLVGAPWVERQGPWASTFLVGTVAFQPRRAWLLPVTSAREAAALHSWSGNPTEVCELLQRARPLDLRSMTPERWEAEVAVEGSTPVVVIVSQLAHPNWRASWTQGNRTQTGVIRPVFTRPGQSGWQGLAVPGPGAWTLRLQYSGRDVYLGMAVSAAAWLLGIVGFWTWGRGPSASKGEQT